MPRILFVDHTAELGGAELFLYDVATALKETCGVALLSGGPLVEKLKSAGVNVHEITADMRQFRRESGVLDALQQLPAVAAAVAALSRLAAGYDVLMSNSQKSAVVAMLAGVISGKPVVTYLHDILNSQHFSAFNQFVFVALSRTFAKRVLVNSSATKEAYIAAGGDAARTEIVYNGFNVPSVTGVAPDMVARKVPVIGCFSRLAPWKGQSVLLEAVSLLKKPVRLLLVGTALFDENDFEAKLKNDVARLGLQDKVEFLGFRNDVFDLMRACDIVVAPSTAPEPFGRAIVEAQLASRAVIASDGGGVRDIIDDGKNGFLVPADDPEFLSEAIGRLVEDGKLRKQLADAGYRSARIRFELSTTVNKLEETLRAVVDGY